MHKVNQVLVVGGTHGNELSGIRIVEQWAELARRLNTSAIEFNTLLANPEAVDKRLRFVEADLNRQFSTQHLAQVNHSKEAQIAQTLYKQFGPDSNAQPDLVIDIHNTTSNMGTSLILLERNLFNQQLARFINTVLPACHLLLEDDQSYADHPYLCSLGKSGVMIEMGAQPHGVCRADIFANSLKLLECIAEFLSLWNEQKLQPFAEASVYQFIENIHFPLDSNQQVTAMVHPSLQDNDFCPLSTGEPIFTGFDGKVQTWDEAQTIYPHFINEAAYQSTNVAFASARKFNW